MELPTKVLFQTGCCQVARSNYQSQGRIPTLWSTSKIIIMPTQDKGLTDFDALYLLRVGSHQDDSISRHVLEPHFVHRKKKKYIKVSVRICVGLPAIPSQHPVQGDGLHLPFSFCGDLVPPLMDITDRAGKYHMIYMLKLYKEVHRMP